MKVIPALIAALIVLSAVVAIVPMKSYAASGPDSITTNNVYGNAQTSFTVNGALFYSVYVNLTGPQTVIVSLINTTSGSTLFAQSVTTSSSGSYQSWVVTNFNFFDLSGYPTGNYKLQLTVTGQPVANASFKLFNPTYTAVVRTTLSNYALDNSYYLIGSYVYVEITATDQFGNPMSGNTSASLYELLYAGRANTTQNRQIAGHLIPNDYGIATTYFYSGIIGYQVSGYNLTAEYGGTPPGSTASNPKIGHSVYYIIAPSLTISPYRSGNIYGQGTNLTFQGYFAPFDGAINITIVSDSDGSVIYNNSNQPLSGGYWNGSYTPSYSIPDGLYLMNISEASNNYSLYDTSLQLQALELTAYANENYYLPGEPATIFYTVTNTSNNAPASDVNVTYIMNYTNAGGAQSLTGIVTGGVLNLAIPSTAVTPSSVIVTLRAVDPYGHSASQILYLEAEQLLGSVSTSQGAYFQGTPVIIQVMAVAGRSLGSSSPVAGALAYVNVSVAGTVVLSYSGSALTTDAQGIASYAFMLSNNAALGTYTVDAVIKAYGWTNTTITSFSVEKQTASYELNIVPGQSSYVGGEQFTASWSLVSNGTALTPAFATYTASIGNSVIAAGTNSNGVIQFQLPTDTSGTLFLQVSASDSAGNSASGGISVSVDQALLSLSSSMLEYTPSSVITFSYSVVGTGFSSPEFFYTVTDASGSNVLSGSTLALSFKFTVPKAPSSYYTVTVTATNRTSGGVLTQSISVYELNGLQLTFSISQSSYVSGSYSPGQKVSIYYRITALGGSSLSSNYYLYVWLPGIPTSYHEYSVSKSSGTVTFTIPAGISQGSYQIDVFASSASGSGSTPTVAQSLKISQVEPFWNYNVIGGVSIGSVLLGIVTLVALAIAVLAYTGKGSGGQRVTGRNRRDETERGQQEDDEKGQGR